MVANPIERYRRAIGLTQAEFAALLSRNRGWPAAQSQVAKWERGAHAPSRATAIAIEQATGGEITARELLAWARRHTRRDAA